MAAVADVVDMEEEKEGDGEGRVEGTGEMSILTGGGFFVGLEEGKEEGGTVGGVGG